MSFRPQKALQYMMKIRLMYNENIRGHYAENLIEPVNL